MEGNFVFLIAALVSSISILNIVLASPVPSPKSEKETCLNDGTCEVLDDMVIYKKISVESAVEADWPNGIIPYVISSSISGNSKRMKLVQQAIDDLNEYTCITLVPRTNERDRIIIGSKDDGCHSIVGYKGGPQEVNLGKGCFGRGKGTPIHEIIHSMGWHHEQARDDRDEFVKIIYKNIKPDKTRQFDKSKETTYTFGVPYNYDSLMHYTKNAFAKQEDLITIQTLNNPDALGDGNNIGQRDGLSDGDVQMINAKYSFTQKCANGRRSLLPKVKLNFANNPIPIEE